MALYESTPGATYKSIAADLGVTQATLREWVLRDRGRRSVTAAAAKPAARPREAVPSADPDERVRRRVRLPADNGELREKGRRVNEKRVARIMRTFSITGIRLRRRVRTTVADPAASQVPDLFRRDFTATEPCGGGAPVFRAAPAAGGSVRRQRFDPRPLRIRQRHT